MALINCPECNKEVSDKAEVCPHCGIKICDFIPQKENKRNVDITKDKLIFSTRKDKRSPWFWIGYTVLGVVLVFVYFYLINWLLGYFFGVVSAIGILALVLVVEGQILQQDKSYIDIYENHVEGITYKSKECEGGVNFSALYSEILKVDMTQGFIIIHTRYNNYKVQALAKESECKNIICKKLY